MTPKEKAAELMDTIFKRTYHIKDEDAKQCALIAVDEIIEYCQKYQNPEMMLFIVGLEWLAYHYDDILTLPQDKSINYPENIKTINLNLFSRIFQLTNECQKELNKIVNLNDNLEALKKLSESSKITLHDTMELKEELKQKGWFFLI